MIAIRAPRTLLMAPRWLTAICLAAAGVVGTGLYLWVRAEAAHIGEHWRDQLTAMADDRAVAIDTWATDRLADARTVAAYPSVIYLAGGLEGPPYPFPREAGVREHVVDLLRGVERHHGYEASWVVATDPAAGVLAATGEREIPSGIRDSARSARDVRLLFDFSAGDQRVFVIAPVWPGQPGEGRTAAAVVMARDPGRDVYPLLRREPAPSRTGETLLVSSEADETRYLSPLRHRGDPPGTLRIAHDPSVPLAAAASNGSVGTYVDYRGVQVLAAAAAIRSAQGWSLIAKIDRDEALEVHRTRLRVAAGGGLLLALTLAALGFGLWQHQDAKARLAVARSEAHLAHLVDQAADAILFIRADGRIARANRRAEELYGYTREELLALRVHDLYPPDQLDLIAPRMQAARQGRGVVFEAEHRAKDGSSRPVEVASRFLDLDDEGVFLSIVRDARERKAVSARIEALHRTLRTRSAISQLMVREADRERLLQEACRILVEHGGFAMAWIGLRDRQTEWIVPGAWAGDEEDFLSEGRLTADERSPRGRGPFGTAVREGRSVSVDVAASETTEPWHQVATERGYRSATAVPLRGRSDVTGVLGLFAMEPGPMPPEVLALVEELAGDIGFALEALEARRERDESVARLAESRDFLQNLIDSSSAAIYTVRPDGRVGEVWNPAAERLFGWPREEAIGEVLPIVGEDRQDEFRTLRRQILEGWRIAEIHVTRRRKDGTPVEMSLAASPMKDQEGRITGILAVAIDLSERAETDRRLRQLSAAVEQSPAAIVITDLQGTIEYVNPAFTRHSGYTREEAVGQNPRILKSGHHPREFYVGLFDALGRGEEVRTEMVNRRKSGELYRESAIISPILDADGRPTHYVAVKEDITERRHAEEALRRTQDELAQSQKLEAVGRLAGGIAHDFNNLLGVIIGHGEWAESSLPPGDGVRRRLGQILEASRRAADLTRQLLAFSRRQVLESRVVDVNASVAEMQDLLQRLLGEDVRLVTHLAPAPCRVRIDPGQLSQVLMNLAVNARDAMPRGGTLQIGTTAVSGGEPPEGAGEALAPGHWVRLVVADDGTGMSEEVRVRAFDPFFTTKPEGEGSGLGLAMVYGIVKQSGGTVWLDTAPGQGARFTIHLPRAEDPAEAPASRPRERARGTEMVLVAEDQESLRELICEMLIESGYSVLQAADGPEALEISAACPEPIDLLVTDVVMPRMNGRDLLDRLRATRPGIRALFVSGYTSDVILRRGAEIGQVRLLEKPFGRETLLAAIRDTLNAPPVA